MSPFAAGFHDEIVKLAASEDDEDGEGEGVLHRKGRGAIRGAATGAGVAIGLPAMLALMFASKGKKLRHAGTALRTMTGRLPKNVKGADLDEAREFARYGLKATKASALTGGMIGGALG